MELLSPISHLKIDGLARRVEPGEIMPAGECECGGLLYLFESMPAPKDPLKITDLIAKGESQTLEFKSTARWSIQGNIQDIKMEQEVVQAVAGFLNSKDGGTLLVGAGDNGELIGLGYDYQTLGKKCNRDGFQLWLHDKLLYESACGQDCTPHLEISIEQIRGRDICMVVVTHHHPGQYG